MYYFCWKKEEKQKWKLKIYHLETDIYYWLKRYYYGRSVDLSETVGKHTERVSENNLLSTEETKNNTLKIFCPVRIWTIGIETSLIVSYILLLS